MSDFEEYFQSLNGDVANLIHGAFSLYKKEFEKISDQFLVKMKSDIEQWTMQLATGKLTQEEFSQFIRAKQSLLQMRLLEAKGVSQIEAEKFKDGVINLVISSASKHFLKV